MYSNMNTINYKFNKNNYQNNYLKFKLDKNYKIVIV